MLPQLLEKLQISPSSIVVDAMLVVILIYNAGQLTQRLEQLDKRLSTVETIGSAPTMQKVAILEQRLLVQDRDRQEIRESLRDINNKLDGLASGSRVDVTVGGRQ